MSFSLLTFAPSKRGTLHTTDCKHSFIMVIPVRCCLSILPHVSNSFIYQPITNTNEVQHKYTHLLKKWFSLPHHIQLTSCTIVYSPASNHNVLFQPLLAELIHAESIHRKMRVLQNGEHNKCNLYVNCKTSKKQPNLL